MSRFLGFDQVTVRSLLGVEQQKQVEQWQKLGWSYRVMQYFYPQCLQMFSFAKKKTVLPEERLDEGLCRKKTQANSENMLNRYEMIPEIPHVNLTIEQMNSDPITLLAQLEEKYSNFGAIRLTVSQGWNCPFTFRYVDKGITTRVQSLKDLKHGKAFEQNVEAYSIQSFQAAAHNFQRNYSFKTQPQGISLCGKKEQEYWSLATKPQYESKQVKVEYAADLPSSRYGSGFPTRAMPNWKDSDFVYEKNLFNLNNIKNSPSSILRMADKRKQKISGITHPWVYMGMQFSTFCWHVQDLWVNSLNYNHKGSIKTWYIIPGSYKQKFDDYITSTYCNKNSKKTLLNRITFMVDPLQLIDNGIPVYKTYQSPRDYVCTFFKAYHCGFSQGFNIGEAVNFLHPNSIPLMKQAELYKQKQQKKAPKVFPLEWIIHQNYRNIDSFQDQKYFKIIKQSFEEMLEEEKNILDKITPTVGLNKVQIFPSQTKYDKYQCSVCRQYLFLHAFQVDDKKIFCTKHIKENLKFGNMVKLLIREPIEEREELVMDLLHKYNQDFQQQEQKRTEKQYPQKQPSLQKNGQKEDKVMF